MIQQYDPSGTIAMFIAASLQFPQPHCNEHYSSTIRVDQHKNKFNQVVVYCELADENLVSELWAFGGSAGLPTKEYRVSRLIKDARRYRRSYRQMIFLAPQYKDMILARPDYGYLLFDDIDMFDEWLNVQGKHILERWHADNIDQLRSYILEVYQR